MQAYLKGLQSSVTVLGQEDSLSRRDRLLTPVFLGFPGGSDGKESSCNAGDLGSISGLGRRTWQPIPVFLPGESPWTKEPVGLQSMGSQSPRHHRRPAHLRSHPRSPTAILGFYYMVPTQGCRQAPSPLKDSSPESPQT